MAQNNLDILRQLFGFDLEAEAKRMVQLDPVTFIEEDKLPEYNFFLIKNPGVDQ